MQYQGDLFQLPEGEVYLNNAYMAPLLKSVEAAGKATMERQRLPQFGADDFFGPNKDLRSKFAALINAPNAERVAVIPSASYGLSTAAANLHPRSDQHILLVDAQFPSNVYPWKRVTDATGCGLKTVGPTAVCQAQEWNTRILESIGPDTAVVAMPHVHWADGSLFDLVAIGSRCREVGAALIIDGTQSVGALPFDLQAIQPDAVICAGYKWLLGPYGLGLGWFGPRFDDGQPLEDNWMHRKGSEEFHNLVNYQEAYRPFAGRYNMGESSSFTYAAMLNASLDQLLEWGVDNIAAYASRLTSLVDEALVPLGYRLEDEAWRSPHLFGIHLPDGLAPEHVSHTLAQHGVRVSVRGAAIRVSVNVFNQQSDLLALHNCLKSLVVGQV